MSATYLIGDTFDRMAGLSDGSVDLVLTSPPFLALRSYLPDDHPDKAREIGSEPTPAEFIDTLLALTAEWGRVLAPHGSIAVELGDTYAGSGGAGGDYNDEGLRAGQGKFEGSARRARGGWPLDKSLTGIPTLYAWSLAYGRNLLREPFTAAELLEWVDRMRASGVSADAALALAGGWVAEHGDVTRYEPWRIRNVVAWVRPNPPVGALGDKFRPATSYMTIATRARDRWFDLDDVRTPFKRPDAPTSEADAWISAGPKSTANGGVSSLDKGRAILPTRYNTHAGAPPLDWWEIPTEPYKGAHYATWPRRLCERPIRAMCPSEVCRVCGEPRRRIVEVDREYHREAKVPKVPNYSRNDGGAGPFNHTETRTTTGWTDCGHGDYRRGVVLDPFAGSGTTLAVATGLGRDAIGIDLDERNAELALDRVGPMLLDVVRPGEAA